MRTAEKNKGDHEDGSWALLSERIYRRPPRRPMKRFDNNRHAASYGDNINRPSLFLPALPLPPLSLSDERTFLIKSDDTVTVYPRGYSQQRM